MRFIKITDSIYISTDKIEAIESTSQLTSKVYTTSTSYDCDYSANVLMSLCEGHSENVPLAEFITDSVVEGLNKNNGIPGINGKSQFFAG